MDARPPSPSLPDLRYGHFRLTERDRRAFTEHLLRLDDESRRRRFGCGYSDEAIRSFAARFPLEGTTTGLFIWGELRGTASVVPIGPGEGEFAISLLPQLQGRGWGRTMTRDAMRLAYEMGLSFIHIQYLPENKAMARIASSYPGPHRLEAGDVVKTVDLHRWAEEEGIWLALAT